MQCLPYNDALDDQIKKNYKINHAAKVGDYKLDEKNTFFNWPSSSS